MSPSDITTAPTGTSSRTEPARASRSAACIPVRSLGEAVPLRTDHLGLPGAPLDSVEPQLVALALDPNGVAVPKVALRQLGGDGVFQPPLDDALQRSRSIDWIVSLCRNKPLGLRSD